MNAEDFVKNPEQSKSEGSMTSKLGDFPAQTYRYVALHFFGPNKGGYISGAASPTHSSIVGFPPVEGDGKHTFQYPKDFQKMHYAKWSHQEGGKYYDVKEGTLTVTFSNGQSKAEGEYKIVTEEGLDGKGIFTITNK